jgi:hypothetical protein
MIEISRVAVPRLVKGLARLNAEGNFVVDRDALAMLAAVDGRTSIDDMARIHGTTRTYDGLTKLVAMGSVCLDAAAGQGDSGPAGGLRRADADGDRPRDSSLPPLPRVHHRSRRRLRPASVVKAQASPRPGSPRGVSWVPRAFRDYRVGALSQDRSPGRDRAAWAASAMSAGRRLAAAFGQAGPERSDRPQARRATGPVRPADGSTSSSGITVTPVVTGRHGWWMLAAASLSVVVLVALLAGRAIVDGRTSPSAATGPGIRNEASGATAAGEQSPGDDAAISPSRCEDDAACRRERAASLPVSASSPLSASETAADTTGSVGAEAAAAPPGPASGHAGSPSPPAPAATFAPAMAAIQAPPAAATPTSAAVTPVAAETARPAPATQQPRILFDERFADNRRGWPNDPGSTAWLADGGYRLFARHPERFVAIGAPDSASPAQVVVTGLFRKVGGPPGGGYGVVVRDQRDGARDGVNQDGRYYVLEVGDRGEIGIWRRDGDRWIDLVPWTPSPIVRAGSEPNEITVRVGGARLLLMVNGHEAASTDDGTFTSGAVGLFVGGDGNQVLVESLRVEAVE